MINEKLLSQIINAKAVTVISGKELFSNTQTAQLFGVKDLLSLLNSSDISNLKNIFNSPQLKKEWYKLRLDIYLQIEPSLSHYAIAELEAVTPVYIITKNMSKLHQKANSKNVLELQGNFLSDYCVDCFSVFYDNIPDANGDFIEHCPKCSGDLFPVFSNFLNPENSEILDVDYYDNIDDEVMNNSYQAVMKADIIIYVGFEHYDVKNMFFANLALRNNKYTISISSSKPPDKYSYFNKIIKASPEEFLPNLIMEINALASK